MTVYKLVTKGTVDEGIYDMGSRKTELINSVLSFSGTIDGNKAIASDDKVCLMFWFMILYVLLIII